MIDLHCHILPGIDDGAANLGVSPGMAQASVADGVSVVVCTPHILPGLYHNAGPDRFCGAAFAGCSRAGRHSIAQGSFLPEMPNAGLIGCLTKGVSISWRRTPMILTGDLRI
jgi:hypothetical protein